MANDVTYKFNKINKVFVTFCAMASVPSGNCNDKTIWTKMQSNLCMQAIIMINIHIFSYVQVSLGQVLSVMSHFYNSLLILSA